MFLNSIKYVNLQISKLSNFEMSGQADSFFLAWGKTAFQLIGAKGERSTIR